MKVNRRNTKSRPKGIDLFAGVGGMSLGFEQAGFNVAAAIELDKINIQTYRENFPECSVLQEDLRRLSGRELLNKADILPGSIDVVFGGPPCQGFSLIGKRQIQDERNQLLFHFARMVHEIQPRYFVLENVPGLLLGDTVELFRTFRRQIRRYGYELVEPVKVLDSTKFGIPQKRLRAFLLGFRKGIDPPCYPKPFSIHMDRDQFMSPTVWDAIGDLAHLDDYPELFFSDRYHGDLGTPSQYAKSLSYYNEDKNIENLSRIPNSRGLGGCCRTKHSDEVRNRFESTKPGTIEQISRFFRLASNGVSPTLRSGTGPDHGSHTAVRPIHPKIPRCITTREAARLHSFPDWFEFHPTKWHGFQQVGNSVPPQLAKAVAKSVINKIIL